MDIIADFAKPYAFTRYLPATVTKGKMDPKSIVVNDPATNLPWTMDASVQNLKYSEVMVLPENLRNRDAVNVFTQTQLQTANPQGNLLGDRFTYKGYIYEIMKSVDWTDYDLPYFKFVAVRIED